MSNRRFVRTVLATVCVFSSVVCMAAPASVRLAPVEREARLTEDMLAPTGTPLRYAEVRALRVIMQHGAASTGTWSDAGNAQGLPLRRWSFTISTPGALSQDFGFAHLFLPHGASLVLRSADGLVAAGPYTDAEVAAGRRFQTAYVVGDTATLEIDVPAALERNVSFALDRVAPAHREIFGGGSGGLAKSGSCNVDVRCPQGAPYPDQINTVARYSFNGFLCTGALINNASGDRAPYFLTANHCVDTQAEASTMVLYWKYESPTCRATFSGASGTPIPLTGNSVVQTGGADLRATEDDSDFTLVRLRNAVPPGASGFLAGWDRRSLAPSSAFTIHHPQGDEKRISFDNNPLQIFDQSAPGLPFGNSFLRVVNYELGTTEGGSSGGPLFNPERRIVGQLAGGAALCSVPDGDDYFGRLSTSFTRGATAATRLRDWLDPANTGVQTLDGVSLAGCTPPAASLDAPAVARAGEAVNLTLTLPAGTYRVEWDVDGDGIVDRVKPTATGTQLLQPVYPAESNQSVVVRVIAAGGCTTTLQRTLVVDGPRVSVTTSSAPQQLCGDGDAAVEPGERWRVAVSIRNAGAKSLTDGHAVFAPVSAASVRLETPAIAIPALGANGVSTGGLVDFAIPTTATCGSVASIRYIAALDRTAWSTEQSSTPIGITLGNGGPCNIVDFCPAQITTIAPRIGLFANSNRFGNGFGTVVTDNPDAAPPVFFSAWFSGTAARLPIWYTVQGALVDNRVDADVRQFRRVGQTPFAVTGSIVGSAQVTYLSATDYLFTFNLGGRTGAERQSLALPDTSVRPDRTGAWVFTPESGSGYIVDDARNGGVPAETVISFIYGTDNEPRWTFGAKALADPGGIVSDYFEIQCPTCPSLLDFTDTRVNAGTLTPTYSSLTTGTLSTNLVSPAPASLNWVRTNVPIEMISTPRPQ